ncbi:MAG: hypothetical protein IT426_17075 [Pirellulales bacterium]|nr:hypothetical protein [Pirellulales bacterium]
MRLTLRNLLAYLDGILEPQDAQDLSVKIEESKFASDLLHRIRDLMRRMRLAAPGISERGPGLDPNTVAEYLDNTLPADRVTDFEKVCLEANTAMADFHLAEVAACHQVLTLVLGEPAEIDPPSRERIYQLPVLAKQQESAPQAPSAHLPPPIPSHPQQQSFAHQDYSLDYRTRSKPTVPDYLREPRKKRPWFAIATGTLAAVCLLLIVLNVSRQFERDSALANLFVRWGWMSPQPEVAANAETSKKEDRAAPKQANVQTTATEAQTSSVKDNPESTQPPPSPDIPVPPALGTPNAPPGGTPPLAPLPGGEVQSGPGELVNAVPPPPSPPGSELQPAVPLKTALDAATFPPKDRVATLPPSGGGLTVNAPVAPANPVGELPIASQPIGRFTSLDPQILLRSNGDSGNWERAPDKAILYPQQHLLAPPTFRPAITLTSNLILQLLGGTEVALLPEDRQMPSGIKLRYGRVAINSVANPGMKLRLVVGEQTVVLTFLDPDSNLAVYVRRVHAPGTNPEDETNRLVTEIFVTKDRVALDDGTGKPLEIAAPALVHLFPQIPPVTDRPKDFPKWIASAESIADIDRRASQVMLDKFTAETPAQQKLLELADPGTRLIELRRLAVRCLGYVGYFDPMVAALNDLECKGEWLDKYFEWLCEAVKRDPQTAAAVREALEKNYSPQAENLYRMLWGYTDRDLSAGEDARLVKNLDDENLPVRILAFCNLKTITEKDLGYKPEAPLPQRARMVQQWEQRLKIKEIRNKQADRKSGPALPEPPPTAPPPPPAAEF